MFRQLSEFGNGKQDLFSTVTMTGGLRTNGKLDPAPHLNVRDLQKS
jgi:hypothetical protein